MDRPLKRVDLLRHELKALRYILNNLHEGKLKPEGIPSREDFQSGQTRTLYDIIIRAPDRASAERQIAELELEDVDIASFLRLNGEHYYTYPNLVKQRGEAIRSGALKVETA